MKNRLPVWFKQELPSKDVSEFSDVLRREFQLNTVCHSAKCPNMSTCFRQRHATFLILGSRCTRSCRFCAVEPYTIFDNAKNYIIDTDEPYRIAKACQYFNLKYVVVTSVTRDDLMDGGAGHFVDTIQAVKELNPDIMVEVLIPDFMGSINALEEIVKQGPDVISHNLETAKRIYPLIRNKANYNRSLSVLKNIRLISHYQTTKSSLMLGLGEVDKDIEEALEDLRSVHCDMLVLGQYLQPSLEQYPVQRFYSPEEFKYWEKFAYGLGFRSVYSSPKARTSYQMKTQLDQINGVRQFA